MQRLKRSGTKPAKIPQKPAKKRKNPQILKSRCLGNFRIFLEFQKSFTVCVHGRSAEIFPETFMFGTKWIIFWVVWPIFLELPFFPRQWRVEAVFRVRLIVACFFHVLPSFCPTIILQWSYNDPTIILLYPSRPSYDFRCISNKTCVLPRIFPVGTALRSQPASLA